MVANFFGKEMMENFHQLVIHSIPILGYMHQDNKANYALMLVNEMGTITHDMEHLIDKVEHGNVTTEMACIDLNLYMDDALWQEAPALFEAQTYGNDEVYGKLAEAMGKLQVAVEQLDNCLKHAPATSYAQFHGLCTMRTAAQKAKRDYDKWKTDVNEEDMLQELKDKRQQEIYKFYESGFLRYDQDCKQKQQKKSEFKLDFDALPDEAVSCKETDRFCACLPRYVNTASVLMELKTDKVGRYLFDHYTALKAEDHYALIYFEVMLELIQENMKELVAKQAEADDTQEKNELFTPEGLRLLGIAQREGWLDEHYQPVNLSNSECAILADGIGFKLKLKNKWKPFIDLWGIKSLRMYLDRALNQEKTVDFSNLVEKKIK